MHLSCSRVVLGLLAGSLFPIGAAMAQESEPSTITMGAHYIGDVVHVDADNAPDRLFLVHEAEAWAEADLDKLVGLSDLHAGVHLLATAGAQPNEAAGTLQGINNVEVDGHRLRLYQAWLEKAFAHGRASLRLGLTDLNEDFYQNDSAGLLLGPAFGIGSELAATGPNGPSTFPSTALTARLAVHLNEKTYGKVAIVNARAGVLGDPQGVDLSMKDGLLLIGEVGTTGRGKLGAGVWGYTESQPDIYDTAPDGSPEKRTAAGAYILADYRLTRSEERGVYAFFRAGHSDGATTPFCGGFQAGILINRPIASRPDGQFSLGVQQGQLSRRFRRLLLRDQGVAAAPSEWGVELTYSDQVMPFLSVQPDVQFIRRSYSVEGSRLATIFTLRLKVAFGAF